MRRFWRTVGDDIARGRRRLRLPLARLANGDEERSERDAGQADDEEDELPGVRGADQRKVPIRLRLRPSDDNAAEHLYDSPMPM